MTTNSVSIRIFDRSDFCQAYSELERLIQVPGNDASFFPEPASKRVLAQGYARDTMRTNDAKPTAVCMSSCQKLAACGHNSL